MKILREPLVRPEPPASVTEAVSGIVDDVRARGDAALVQLTARFDGANLPPDQLRVDDDRLGTALDELDSDVRSGLETAIANVRAVVEAQLRPPVEIKLEAGQEVSIAELAVRRAGIYAPGGRAAYPSTVVMCAVTARAAGVDRIAVCAPPGADGSVDATTLAACALCGVDDVFRVGGAQSIAALALGTETVAAVDVIAGPGNAYVQEAKRQLVGVVGIDGIAGPSELVVVAAPGADPELLALDLLAQGEHGPDSLIAVIATDADLLEAVVDAVQRLALDRPSVAAAELYATHVADPLAAVAEADRIAPEHLELAGADVEVLAAKVRSAGCLFVGRGAATAFGDYVAGTNHVLPTGGAARFQSALSAATFRRRMARVSFSEGAAGRLAPAGAAIARAEGFPVHAESMERRA